MEISTNTKPFDCYLNAGPGRFHLDIPLVTEEPVALENSPYPFSILSDSDPVSRLLEGRILSDQHGVIETVLLQLQRDRYLLQEDRLWPVHNPAIETYWQKTFSFHTGGRGNPIILLANQIDERGKLVPFQPLFFCKTKRNFFPPPCPSCGSTLDQCYDDDLLIRAGLAPYSASSKRYLFCPVCTPKDLSHFYTSELDGSEPAFLKDRRGLIEAFGKAREEDLRGRLPCVSCSSSEECFGLRQSALFRIVPFSFYPFYMFMFGGLSLNASDFLALLSGASFQDLEQHLRKKGESGRIGSLQRFNSGGEVKTVSLFEGERQFLEVLFLKLSFLAGTIESFLGDREISDIPEIRISPDRVWVSIEKPNGILPSFWNFKIKIIDLYPSPLDSPPWKSGGESLFFLGLFWFFTLLFNRDRDMGKIVTLLEVFSPEWNFSKENLEKKGEAGLGLPENIFWDPAGNRASEWRNLWERSVHLGGQLIECGCKGKPWQKNEFLAQLEALRKEVKALIFEPPRSVTESPPVAAEKEAIRAILLSILEKWRRETGAKEDSGDTTLLPIRETSQAPQPPRPSLKKEQETIPETVILARAQATEKRAGLDDAVPDTVIISPGKEQQKLGRTPWPSSRDREEEMTRIAGEQKATRAAAPQKEFIEDDLLSETIILGSEKLRELAKKKGT